MPHHLRKSGLLERAAQMAAGTGKRSSDRAAPCKKERRGGGGARGWAGPGWTGKHIPLRTAWHQQGLNHNPEIPLDSNLPLGVLWWVAPGKTSTLSKLSPPGRPKLGSCIPQYDLGLSFFPISCLLAWLSHALQVSGSRMLPLRQSEAQRGKQGGECNASGHTGSGWLQQP